MKKSSMNSCTGSLNSFVNRLPANKTYTAKEVLEAFAERKLKHRDFALKNAKVLLPIIQQKLNSKQKILQRIYGTVV